ncbi:unnamed protein product [Meganyctiphanes norvegica]|uniref:Reverse transcriptase domain-containing protein n=1 Tax=Meganyctiphanes norvegica TaxID=48144 RepID=A0AAV2SJW4_MEGNR
MDGLENISSMICMLDFLASLDLQDAFLTIAMHPSCYKYLCFDFEGVRYCFIALVFGLSCAPRIFTKMLKVPLSSLRLNGIKCSAWIDDILLVGSSLLSCTSTVSYTISFLESLGFIIKPSKSNLTPSQSIRHVGFIWDTVRFTVSVPPEKVEALKDLCSSAISRPISLRFLARIIGTIDSFKFGCPIAPLHYRSLQLDLVKHLSPTPNWNSLLVLSPSACSDLRWWLECDLDLRPARLTSFSPSHRMETDASLVGWGAYLHSGSYTQGRWSASESKLHINYLELKAVLLAIQSLLPGFSEVSLLVLCDNTPTVCYINHMGGTKSRFLCASPLNSGTIVYPIIFGSGQFTSKARIMSVPMNSQEFFLTPMIIIYLLPGFPVYIPILTSALTLTFLLLVSTIICLVIPLVCLTRVRNSLTRSPYPGLATYTYSLLLFYSVGSLINSSPTIVSSVSLLPHSAPSSPVFPSILDLCIAPPILLPDCAVIREPRHCKVSQMMAWTISVSVSLQEAFRRTLSPDCSVMWKKNPYRNISLTGRNSPVGVAKGKLILATYL